MSGQEAQGIKVVETVYETYHGKKYLFIYIYLILNDSFNEKMRLVGGYDAVGY